MRDLGMVHVGEGEARCTFTWEKGTPFFWCDLCLCFHPPSFCAMASLRLSFVWSPFQSGCCLW